MVTNSQEALHQLGPAYESVVMEHIADAAAIQQLVAIRDYLIEEFHRKKSTPHSKRSGTVSTYKMTPHVEAVYCKCFFLKRKCNSSLDCFPCSFKGKLEDVMWRQCSTHSLDTGLFDMLAIYYNSDQPGSFIMTQKEQQAAFNKATWSLDPITQELTPADMTIVNKYVAMLLDLFRATIATLDSMSPRIDSTNIATEYRRISKFLPLQ